MAQTEDIFDAIEAGSPELVRALLAAGADIAHAGRNGRTALFQAATHGQL